VTSEEKWISISQAAKISGYHPERIRELVREGKIAARKFSIIWQVDRGSLLEYLYKAQNSGDKRHGPKAK